jgi:predicted permease
VVAQVALVVVLLTGAALLARSLWKLQRVELGLDTSEVLGVTVTRADQRYPAAAETRVFFSELLERVAVTPGVAAVGMVQHLPLTGQRSSTSLGDAGSGGQATFADIRTIAGSFFQATGSRLIAGRTFTGADRENSPNVFIVNRTLARNLGGDVLGRRISFNWGEVVDGKVVATSVAGQVVGIVADVRESGPAVAAAPALYRPFAQDPWPTMSLVVRKGTATADAALAQRISAHVQELDPDQPVVVQPLRGAAAALLARPRMQLILVTAFAGLALLLAGVGLYGVIAFAVDQRRQEIGVRLALGATPEMISRIILQHGLVLTAAGLLAGSAIALIALPLLRSLVYGVSLADPIAISGAAVFVMLVSLLASVIPARRAARLDPLAALRPD